MRRLTPVLALLVGLLAPALAAGPAAADVIPVANGNRIEASITTGRSAHGSAPARSGGGGTIRITYPDCPGHNVGAGAVLPGTPRSGYSYVETREFGGQVSYAYMFRCIDTSGQLSAWGISSPIAPEDAGVTAAADPQDLINAAYDYATANIPGPTVSTSPAGNQLVKFPTWLWIQPADWQDYWVTATVPGMSVTVTATPTVVTWNTGDGVETCDTPGARWTAGTDPRAESPDCGHVYQRSSAAQPGERFTLTATITWRVVWEASGTAVGGGTLDNLTSVSPAETRRVVEVQTLN